MKNTHVEILIVVLLAFVAIGYFHSQDDANSNSRLGLVKAIVEQGRFAIDAYHNGDLKTEDESFYAGHYYTDKAIGSSLVGAEAYRIVFWLGGGTTHPMTDRGFKYLITALAISLPCAIGAGLIYSYAVNAGASAPYALVVAMSIAIGTPLYVYGAAFYGHALAAALLLGGIRPVVLDETAGDRTIVDGLLLWLPVLGYAVITEYPTTLIAAAIGCYALHVLYQQRRLASFAVYVVGLLGVAIPVGAALLYNHAVYGNALAIGYGSEFVGTFRSEQATGLMGIGAPNLGVLFAMTFNTTSGIFWQSPVLLLAFPGWALMWREKPYRAEAILSAGVVAIYFLAMSGYYDWWGGLAFTPRHILPALPFFAIPLASLVQDWRRGAAALTVVSVLQMLIVIAAARNDGLGQITIGYSRGAAYRIFENSTIYNVYWSNFAAGRLNFNLGQVFGLGGYTSLIPLGLIAGGLVVALLICTKGKKPT